MKPGFQMFVDLLGCEAVDLLGCETVGVCRVFYVHRRGYRVRPLPLLIRNANVRHLIVLCTTWNPGSLKREPNHWQREGADGK